MQPATTHAACACSRRTTCHTCKELQYYGAHAHLSTGNMPLVGPCATPQSFQALQIMMMQHLPNACGKPRTTAVRPKAHTTAVPGHATNYCCPRLANCNLTVNATAFRPKPHTAVSAPTATHNCKETRRRPSHIPGHTFCFNIQSSCPVQRQSWKAW